MFSTVFSSSKVCCEYQNSFMKDIVRSLYQQSLQYYYNSVNI